MREELTLSCQALLLCKSPPGLLICTGSTRAAKWSINYWLSHDIENNKNDNISKLNSRLDYHASAFFAIINMTNWLPSPIDQGNRIMS